ncbi:hypothetical protein [Paraburkholderia graminis]|uniref:hypothetical protein n=1 Tax=Paraburkholderia graminis TaxID=60548 RepID=UPI0038B9B1D4
MNDEQILDVIKSVCGFDGAGVERFRAEALIIGRAVEQASRRAALEEAITAAEFVASRYNSHTPHPAEHPHVQGMRDGTFESLKAIRALAKETNNG